MRHLRQFADDGLSINRNIVECKLKAVLIEGCMERVLIETLWNVNMQKLPKSWELMEVLIETLWNVNLALKMTWDIKSVVLIETLWNVNSNPAIALTVHPWY